MKYRTAFVGVLIALSTLAALSDEKAPSPGAARFEAIKKLAGNWVEIGKDGKPSEKVISSFRVTAGGTVVQETIFPGTDHEMVTMYHLDGPDLVLKHYCVLGNQPTMRAEAGTDASQIEFKCSGGTNLKSEAEQHMHQATLTIVDKDHFKARWIACKEGKECHDASFNLARKQ